MTRRLLQRITELCVSISCMFMLAMMIHVTADVVMKYLWNRPIPGTLEVVSAYYMVGGVFLPIAAVEFMRRQIVVDVAYQFMGWNLKAFCIFVGLVMAMLVYAVLACTSWGDAMRSLAIREVMMGTVLVSVWPSRFVLPISFAAAGLVCLWQIYAFITLPDYRAQLIDAQEPEEDI